MNTEKELEFRSNQCCFTGHRPEKLNISEEKAKELLRQAIKNAISNGFTTFISGMAKGIDIWAAEIVLEEKSKGSNIKLWCASPYKGFEAKWNETDLKLYNNIIDNADYVKYVCKHYTRSCFQTRNVWMVDRSSRVIDAHNGEKGGTKNTIDYAKRVKVDVHNILADE